jgi:hypothetical protein
MFESLTVQMRQQDILGGIPGKNKDSILCGKAFHY